MGCFGLWSSWLRLRQPYSGSAEQLWDKWGPSGRGAASFPGHMRGVKHHQLLILPVNSGMGTQERQGTDQSDSVHGITQGVALWGREHLFAALVVSRGGTLQCSWLSLHCGGQAAPLALGAGNHHLWVLNHADRPCFLPECIL